MGNSQIVNKLKVFVGAKIRAINTVITYRWLLLVKSQPIAVSQKPAMVFSPHQDDETLGCGGMIALKRALGVPVEVVFLTDGRHGRPDWIKPEEIFDVRKEEAIKALSILGLKDLQPEDIFLDQEDGSLEKLPTDQRQQLIEQLVERLKSFIPEEVYVTHRKDGHGDHDATYELVQEAIAKSGIQVELLQYPIWMFWRNPLSSNLQPEDMANAYRLEISSVQEKKEQAIATYKSQMVGLPKSFMNRFFLPYEVFFKN